MADEVVSLGNLSPDTGRLGIRLWCDFASDAAPVAEAGFRPEDGIIPIVYRQPQPMLLAEPEFDSPLNMAAVLLAAVNARIP